jgi:uncharacterized protein
MKLSGISDEAIRIVTYQNALTAFAQSGQMSPDDLEAPVVIDQSQRFNGSSILRGGQAPRVDKSSTIIR